MFILFYTCAIFIVNIISDLKYIVTGRIRLLCNNIVTFLCILPFKKLFHIIIVLGFFTAHVDDVRAIVNRAVKDLSIEQSLKTYEEVWLSKVFELRQHVRSQTVTSNSKLSEEKPDALAVSLMMISKCTYLCIKKKKLFYAGHYHSFVPFFEYKEIHQ